MEPEGEPRCRTAGSRPSVIQESPITQSRCPPNNKTITQRQRSKRKEDFVHLYIMKVMNCFNPVQQLFFSFFPCVIINRHCPGLWSDHCSFSCLILRNEAIRPVTRDVKVIIKDAPNTEELISTPTVSPLSTAVLSAVLIDCEDVAFSSHFPVLSLPVTAQRGAAGDERQSTKTNVSSCSFFSTSFFSFPFFSFPLSNVIMGCFTNSSTSDCLFQTEVIDTTV